MREGEVGAYHHVRCSATGRRERLSGTVAAQAYLRVEHRYLARSSHHLGIELLRAIDDTRAMVDPSARSCCAQSVLADVAYIPSARAFCQVARKEPPIRAVRLWRHSEADAGVLRPVCVADR